MIVRAFQAERNNPALTFQKGVETLGLGVTIATGGNSGDKIAFFILLDQYCEFFPGLTLVSS